MLKSVFWKMGSGAKWADLSSAHMWLCPLDLPEDEECELPEKEAGILWDAVCFSFLLIQRRIFLSYYHLYVVADRLVSKAIAPRYQPPRGLQRSGHFQGPGEQKCFLIQVSLKSLAWSRLLA